MTLNSENKKFFILLGIMYLVLGPIIVSTLWKAPWDVKLLAGIPGLPLLIGTIILIFIIKDRNKKDQKWYSENTYIDASLFNRVEYDNLVLFIDKNWAWSFPKDCKNKIYTKFNITKFYNKDKEYISYRLLPYAQHKYTIREIK